MSTEYLSFFKKNSKNEYPLLLKLKFITVLSNKYNFTNEYLLHLK